MKHKKGALLVLVGPSGCGKGTVLAEFLKHEANTFLSVSVTTRSPRPGEVDGVNYHFITQAQYAELLRNDGLLEHAVYVENGYGTPRAPVMEHIDRGENVILEIETQGARQVKEMYPEAVLIFILPPSMAELRRRLTGRGTEDIQTVEKRLNAARQEITYAYECDYLLVNDTPAAAAERLLHVVRAQEASQNSRRFMVDALLSETV